MLEGGLGTAFIRRMNRFYRAVARKGKWAGETMRAKKANAE